MHYGNPPKHLVWAEFKVSLKKKKKSTGGIMMSEILNPTAHKYLRFNVEKNEKAEGRKK